jgi:hypothetical protein
VPQSLEGGRLVLALPNQTLADLLAKQHAQHPDALATVIRDLCQVTCKVIISAGNGAAPAQPPPKTGRAAAPSSRQPEGPPEGPAPLNSESPPPPPPPPGQRDLVHDVVELFDGRIVDEAEG